MSETAAPAPAKSKKLIIILAVVVLLVVAGGAAAWVLLSKRAAEGDEDGDKPARTSQPAAPKGPPTYLPMDNMVVNLADPGGDRFAQVGITLELADAKTAEQVKGFMPSIRSAVLLLVSQRTTDELLTREGKEKLAVDVRREVSRPLGYSVSKPKKRAAQRDPEDDEDEEDPPPRRRDDNPVRQVLFSSFIIQ
ncbi:flagellar FliL protein [Oryzisolibacter propanilivorax]|uniref:Flagellar protein FliL n=1 Tax=Oryzisolibacter propanilivorax TaxID=1527607 RepID=A0A1G9V3N0_9BURK|nr:flagellar basal body-associated FliL family protein [Oryzisolibacter propanilivorax]SDM66749.1 flagellar FliL protein [Oryzisolibacter propanilivorax]